MEQVKFTVLGEPQGKGRPRFVAKYNPETQKSFGKAYTPDKTVVYENLVRMCYVEQAEGISFGAGEMLDLRIKAFYGIPKSKSKKMKEKMLEGIIRPTKKPDMDNIIKIVADSLNQVAYHDDAQIVDSQCRKFYSEKPRVEVTITKIAQEGN